VIDLTEAGAEFALVITQGSGCFYIGREAAGVDLKSPDMTFGMAVFVDIAEVLATLTLAANL